MRSWLHITVAVIDFLLGLSAFNRKLFCHAHISSLDLVLRTRSSFSFFFFHFKWNTYPSYYPMTFVFPDSIVERFGSFTIFFTFFSFALFETLCSSMMLECIISILITASMLESIQIHVLWHKKLKDHQHLQQ